MNSRFFAGAVLLVAALSGGVFLSPAPAYAADNTAVAAFGIVDLSRLKDSKPQQLAVDALQRTQQSYVSILKRLDQGTARFLTEPEVNELESLYEKATPTDADKKRMGDLEAKGDGMKRELTTLQNTPASAQNSAAATQSGRLQTLNDMQGKGTESLQKLAATLEGKFKEAQDASERKVLGQIRSAVAKIAKNKNLSAVFSSDMALYATTDITDDVLKDLNK